MLLQKHIQLPQQTASKRPSFVRNGITGVPRIIRRPSHITGFKDSSKEDLSNPNNLSPEQKEDEQLPTGTEPSENSSAQTQYSPAFVSRRLIVFLGIVLGYTGLYFTRGSLTYTAPVMVAEPSLGLTLRDIGAMTSAFPIAYGLSKFLGGVLGAKFSPTLMLAGGLAVTAAINLCTTAPGLGVTAMTALWAANGVMQGIGAPASAQLLTRWFASKERGTYWGLWNIGANIGGFLTPVLVGYLAKQYGWQWGMAGPGLVGLTIALCAAAVIRDSPEAAGYPPVEGTAATTSTAATSTATTADKPKSQIWTALKHVMSHKGTWLLAVAYFFVYVVRQGATSWLVFYLMQAKGAADAAAAASTVSGLELGGLVGSTLSGFLSDMRVRAALADPTNTTGTVGQRVQIIIGYVIATFGVLAALKAVPPGQQAMQWLVIAALGFCIYGPQMLIGLCGAELVDKKAVGASQGILGLISYMGAANAGIPLSYVVTTYGWDGYFGVMTAAAACALALLLPLWNARSFVQDNNNPGSGQHAKLAPA